MNKTLILAILGLIGLACQTGEQAISGGLASVNWTLVFAAVIAAVGALHAQKAAASPTGTAPAAPVIPLGPAK